MGQNLSSWSTKQSKFLVIILHSLPLTTIRYDLPKTILQLAWRPTKGATENQKFELAVAGEDSSLRVYSYDRGFLTS